MTKSTGISGLINSGFPPAFTTASRMEAKSTTTGTPVKSCKITRLGLKGISPLDLPDNEATPLCDFCNVYAIFFS